MCFVLKATVYTSLSIIWILQHYLAQQLHATLFVLSCCGIFLVVRLDEGKFGTANAAAEANGDDNPTDFNQKDNKC